MNIEEFEDCVDRYGEDVASWPSPERERGTALVRSSLAARGIVSQAKLLRAAVTGAVPVRAPSGLADRIVACAIAETPVVVPAATAWTSHRNGLHTAFRPAVVLPFCFLVGLAVAWLPSVSDGRGPQFDVSVLLTGMVE